MQQVLGQILMSALAAAISPLPLIGLALIFFSKRPGANSIAYTLGWIIGLLGAAALALTVNNGASKDGNPKTAGWVALVVGLLFLVLAYGQWKHRPRPGYSPPVPKWMAGLNDIKLIPVFGLGILLLGVNAKNLSLAAGAMTEVANHTPKLSTTQQIIAGVLWALVGSLTAIVPTVLFMFNSAKMRPGLEKAKDWLMAHNAVIMMTLFGLLAASNFGKALTILSGGSS